MRIKSGGLLVAQTERERRIAIIRFSERQSGSRRLTKYGVKITKVSSLYLYRTLAYVVMIILTITIRITL